MSGENKRETAAFVCPHVFNNERPVLLVLREDGDWQLLCGQTDHYADGKVVGLEHLIERDPSIAELQDLPVDWEAERAAPGQPWIRTKCTPQQ
ncbi:hypothetical protein [Pseudoduganella armeniaca]|uniref:Uncharacterized protein n=1 Tax=Pseudoduganella armeniaca TaxID=2072590 RepID=A0A2R4CF00_9BURK|nr:hypothetical protein [Pseudoduganella armeniaca]AVR98214.1 hypothetical protein C9I28_23170 [Pseudoduganella armeniaca]